MPNFDVIGDDWDIEARAPAELANAGLDTDLARTVGTLSGGESTLVGIIGLRLARHAVTILDEPTNNLDREARARLLELLADWPGNLLVVSHDAATLRLTDSIAELVHHELTVRGGNWDDHLAQVAMEQEVAARALRTAQQRLKVERRQRALAEQRATHRAGFASKRSRQGLGRSEQHYFTNRAQNSAGRQRASQADHLAAARQGVDAAAAKVRSDETIRIDLPDPRVAASRRLAEIIDRSGRSHLIQGPARVALVGPNGVGKTLLIESMLGRGTRPSPSGTTGRLFTDRVGYLPQRMDHGRDQQSVLENLQTLASSRTTAQIRDRLARFGLRADVVHRPLRTLSGGERFRALLAALLLREPASQLLILDEPTNDIDMTTTSVLVEALGDYRGGLLVVSHDEDFLSRLGVRHVIDLS